MPRLLSRRLAVIVGPPLIVLVLALLALGAARRVAVTRVEVQRARDIISEGNGVLSALIDAESGQRGFLLTGDESYLAPYDSAVQVADQRLASLRRLVGAEPRLRRRVDSLSTLTSLKLAELSETIRERRERGEPAARAMVRTDRGQRLSLDARRIVGEIAGAQRAQLERRAAEEDERTRLTVLALAGGVALAVILAVFVNVLIAREAQRNAALADELAERTALAEAAQADAERGRQRISSVLESIGDAFYALDARWRFTYVNERAEKLLRRPRSELLGGSVWELFPEARDGPLGEHYARAVRTGEATQLELYYAPLDTWFDVRAYPGQGVLSVYFTDITERRRALAERALLAETIPHLVWVTGPDGSHDYYNSRWHEYTGMSREGGDGWDWRDFLHPDDHDRTLALWRHSLETGTPYEIEYRLREATTGRYRWFLGRALPLHDEDGRIIRWFGTCTDIDRAKRAEEGSRFLAEASAVLGASLDWESTLGAVARLAVPRLADWCALYVRDDEGRPRQIALVHRDPERARLVRELEQAYPVRIDAPRGVGAVLRTGRPEVIRDIDRDALASLARDDHHLATIEGLGFVSAASYPLLVDGVAVGAIQLVMAESGRHFDADDEALAAELARRAALAVERARLYADATEARIDAEQANRAKSEFLATMSHELRTPLNAVSGYADLMLLGLRGPLTESQAEDLRRIQRASQHLLALINDILNYARLEAGSVQLELADVRLDDTLSMLEALLLPQVRAKRLRLTWTTSDHGLAARADAEKLRQILVNLLGNAVKFTEAGGEVALQCEAEAGRVRIRVRDTGRGIPADRLATIFDPFVQVDRHRTADSQQGVGLGLAISRDLARAMGGDITVASEVGRGSEFVVELPRAEVTSIA